MFHELHSNTVRYNTFIFINNLIINNKLIIILTPSDAGGNNESSGMKKSFSLKMRVTIAVSETDDISNANLLVDYLDFYLDDTSVLFSCRPYESTKQKT